MPAITAIPTTARDLFAALQLYRPVAIGEELAFDLELPAELLSTLAVLHTGVRALIAGRRWYGERSDRPGLTVLNPAASIPDGITLLCVEGDNCWDRIHPAARIDLPRLFVAETPSQTPRRISRG